MKTKRESSSRLELAPQTNSPQPLLLNNEVADKRAAKGIQSH